MTPAGEILTEGVIADGSTIFRKDKGVRFGGLLGTLAGEGETTFRAEIDKARVLSLLGDKRRAFGEIHI